MDIFKINCDAIEKKDSRLAERLLSLGGGPVEIEGTRTGDFTFSLSGRYFHSRYDPWKEASVQAGEILERKPDWVILFGQGCGYLLRTLVERKKEKIIVYEPSIEILASVLQKVDLSAAHLLENVFLCVDIPSVINAVRGRVDGFDNLVCYHLTPYGLSFPGELSDLTNRVQNAHITNKVAIKTNISSRLGWIENYFKNIGNLAKYPPIDALRNSFRGVPMVIAGAGPSLKKNGELLRELKGKALIMAAITAYLPLVKMGVIPDLVIAAERIDLPEYFTYGAEDKKTRLVLAEVSHPAMFDRDMLGKFTFFNGYVTLSIAQAHLWGSSYFASTGGSVTTTALDMGVMFGCNPIIFVGQDLAFGDGATHVGGGVYGEQRIKIDAALGQVVTEEEYVTVEERIMGTHQLLWLKGLDGKPVASKYDWVTFHQWFESYMAYLKKEGPGGIEVINATEGGAFIEGMVHMPLREAIDRYVRGPVNVDDIMEEAVSRRRPADLPALIASFEELCGGAREIKNLAALIRKEAKAAKKIFKDNGLTLELKKHVDKIRRLEEELFKKTDKANFIWETVTDLTCELKEHQRGEYDENSPESFERELDHVSSSYRKMEEMCVKFIPELNASIGLIKENDAALGR